MTVSVTTCAPPTTTCSTGSGPHYEARDSLCPAWANYRSLSLSFSFSFSFSFSLSFSFFFRLPSSFSSSEGLVSFSSLPDRFSSLSFASCMPIARHWHYCSSLFLLLVSCRRSLDDLSHLLLRRQGDMNRALDQQRRQNFNPNALASRRSVISTSSCHDSSRTKQIQ